MTWSKLSETQRLNLLELYRSERSKNAILTIAGDYGMNPLTLLRRLQEMEKKLKFHEQVIRGTVRPPTIARPVFSSPIIKTNNIILVSDMEIPDQDDPMMEAVLLLGMSTGIRELAIIGDAVKEDVFSRWARTMAMAEESFESEMDLLRDTLKYWLQWFTKIHIRPGNHDNRIASYTNGEVHLGMFLNYMSFKGDVSYHPLRQMWIETDKGLVALYHQKNSSSDGVTTARRMYNTENGVGRVKPYMVWVTHTHHSGFVKSDDGLGQCFALGTTRDPAKTLYYNETPSTRVPWSQSIGMIEDGYGYLYEREATNWKKVLGKYADNSLLCA